MTAHTEEAGLRGVSAAAADAWERAEARAEAAEQECAQLAEHLREAREAAADDREDAARWRALLASQRIRVLGYAQKGTAHMHLGLEVWVTHPGDFAGANRSGAEVLTAYADAAVAAQTTEARHG